MVPIQFLYYFADYDVDNLKFESWIKI